MLTLVYVNTHIQVIFRDGEKGILSRSNFEWNQNDFCQLFRKSKTAEEFVKVWNENTTFNKVTQSAEPIFESQEMETRSEGVSPDETLNPPSPHSSQPKEDSRATKRALGEGCSSEIQPKKPCIKPMINPLDEAIEAKKVGMSELRCYICQINLQGCIQYGYMCRNFTLLFLILVTKVANTLTLVLA